MSRVGKKIIPLPDKVKVNVNGTLVHVEGPLGKGDLRLSSVITAVSDGKQVTLKRSDEEMKTRQLHGTMRALLQNMVSGFSEGFSKVLDIQGIGYRAEVKGETLGMTLGFSHPVSFPIPKGIKIAVEKQTKLTITGSSKELVGQVAASIRGLRPPEPYKGKGIKYDNEVIQRKEGKAAATGSAGGGK